MSSVWIKEQGSPGEFRDFEWQGGYATFSVSVSNLDVVAKYIAKQAEHHRKASFQDELRVVE